ncbi:MAG: glycosyltransferase [Steroidobacteraceae bacterium]|nr:glycosyltransferase [Steroidobacteraceae bacterium]
MHRLALVIPTKDRPEDLRRLLASVAAQTRRPEQVIVVDGSDPPVQAVCNGFRDFPLDYVRVFPPSLARQRNAGMARLRREITHAGYLDDDIVLERDAIEQMMHAWGRADDQVGGIGFNIINRPRPAGMWLKRLFLIEHRQPGRMLRSGCAASHYFCERDIEADWLSGGAVVWRREVIDRFRYDEWFVGTGLLEDVDFSFNVRGAYRLRVASAARLAHYSRPIRPESQYLLGKWQIVNHMYLVRKYRDRGLRATAAWWANAGMVLIHVAGALARRDRTLWLRAQGNLAGIVSELRGRRERIGGFLK